MFPKAYSPWPTSVEAATQMPKCLVGAASLQLPVLGSDEAKLLFVDVCFRGGPHAYRADLLTHLSSAECLVFKTAV